MKLGSFLRVQRVFDLHFRRGMWSSRRDVSDRHSRLTARKPWAGWGVDTSVSDRGLGVQSQTLRPSKEAAGSTSPSKSESGVSFCRTADPTKKRRGVEVNKDYGLGDGSMLGGMTRSGHWRENEHPVPLTKREPVIYRIRRDRLPEIAQSLF